MNNILFILTENLFYFVDQGNLNSFSLTDSMTEFVASLPDLSGILLADMEVVGNFVYIAAMDLERSERGG